MTVSDSFAFARHEHEAGRLESAEASYRQLLRSHPDHAEALHLLGVLLHQTNRNQQAAEMIRQAIAVKPEVLDFHVHLGAVLSAEGRLQEALECYRQSLQVEPSRAETHNEIGNALMGLGATEQASASYERALELQPDYAAAQNNLGISLQKRGRLAAARASFQKALRLEPGYSKAHNNLGTVQRELGEVAAAAASFQAAIQHEPTFAAAHFNLGNAWQTLGREREAADCFREAIRLQPGYYKAHNNLGNVLAAQGQPREAIQCLRRALEVEPGFAEAHVNLGNAHRDCGELRQAIACYQRALELDAGFVEALNNLAIAWTESGRHERAHDCYRRALRAEPSNAEVHHNLSLLHLLLGEFERGWPEYEWRKQLEESGCREFERPLWDGSPLPDQTVLLHAEQGLGDTLHFIRYAPLVKQRVGRVVMLCQQPLRELLTAARGIDQLVTDEECLPEFDVHVPLLSLPGVMGTNGESIPADVPYLWPTESRVRYWQDRLGPTGQLRVGIAWQGNPKYKADRSRSIPLERFAMLAKVAGVQLISLQRGYGTEQLDDVRGRLPMLEFGPEFDVAHGAFVDTAAVMCNLDVFITPDTSVAHLAGALGIPVWLALPHVPEWRWQLEREDSPWYPTMRLFRQRRSGDWSEVFERIRGELGRLVDGQRATPEAAAPGPWPAAKSTAVQSRGNRREQMVGGDQVQPETCSTGAEMSANTANPGETGGERPTKSAELTHRLAGAMRDHQAGRLEAAEGVYRGILTADPDHPDALHLLGVLLHQSNRHSEACPLIERAIVLNPTSAAFHANLGNVLLELGKLDESIASYRRALAIDPEFADAYARLGHGLVARGELEEAVACCRRAVELDPNLVFAHRNLGNALKVLGKLEEAIASFREAIRVDPRFAGGHNNLGIALQEQGRFDEAVVSYRRALELQPQYAAAHYNLGSVLQEQGKSEEAIGSFQRAIQLRPKFTSAHNGLGNAYQRLGKPAEAVACYERVLQLKPGLATAHNNLANALKAQERFDEAIHHFQRALQLDPEYSQAHNNLGTAWQEQGKLDEAVASFTRALELNPDFAECHSNLGSALNAQQKHREAVAHHRRAIEIDPQSAEAHNNLGISLTDLEEFEAAVASFQRALSIKPDFAGAHFNMGNALTGHLRFAEARVCFERALQIKPDYSDAHNNLAIAFIEQGQHDEALACYERAIQISPTPETYHNRGVLHLMLGNFEPGWRDYDWRVKIKDTGRTFAQPRWDGSESSQSTLLVHAEQGLGDTLQFVRYTSLARKRVGRLVLLCQPPLRQLLSDVQGVDVWVTSARELPPFDFHIPMLSLPGVLGTTADSIPAPVPYIEPDPRLVQRWRSRLAGVSEFRVGIAWQGNPAYPRDRFRSIPLAQFVPLASVPGARLISVQKGFGVEQLEPLRDRLDVFELGEDFDTAAGPFMDTAAVLRNLDLFITSDSAVAHLAGALGVRVWLALPLVSDWRWQLDRNDCPWYPSMRLFRQSRRGDWEEVFRRIHDALRALVRGDADRSDEPQSSASASGRTSLQEQLATTMRTHQQGDLAAAESGYRQILAHDADHADALHLLGVVLHQRDRHSEAEELIRRAIGLMPNWPDFHANLGNALASQGRLEEAVASFRQALQLKPTFAQAHCNLGHVLQQQGALAEAVACCERAIELQPNLASAHNNLGNALQRQGQYFEAAASYQRALQLHPNYAEALNNLGTTLKELNRSDEAIGCYQRALQIRPQYSRAHSNLAGALRDQGRLDEALASCQTALQLSPNSAETLNTLGNVWRDRMQFDEALAAFERALELNPNYVEARCNRAMLRLLLGDFARGWPEYESRTQRRDYSGKEFAQPRWDGSVAADQTLLVFFEQGLGDTIQFVRFLPLVRQRVGRVVLLCQSALRLLMSGVAGVDAVVTDKDQLPAFDLQAPLLSLPVLLGADASAIPSDVPYLSANEQLVADWQSRLEAVDGFRIGVCWQGNPEYRQDRFRSIPLHAFACLLTIPEARLISLQKGAGVDQLQHSGPEFEIVDLGPDFDVASGAFMDTAAVMKNIDLVIAPDTATAHVAGALGVPVWVALQNPPDWRWQLDREDSPWYPSMRLFRQRTRGDWQEVVRRMGSELKHLIGKIS